MTQPVRIELRAAQPYVGISVRVTMDGLSDAVDEVFPELFGWLAAHDIQAAGPPFIRYLVIDIGRGAPDRTRRPGQRGDQRRRARPARRPAGLLVPTSLRHTGPYDGLIASNAALQQWARQQGVVFDSWDTPVGLGVARPGRTRPDQSCGRTRPREVGS